MASNFTREVAERGVSLKIVDMARRVSSSVITFDQRKFRIAGKVRSCYLISARRFCCFLCKGRSPPCFLPSDLAYDALLCVFPGGLTSCDMMS
jgi:hypothetical protein